MFDREDRIDRLTVGRATVCERSEIHDPRGVAASA